MKDPYLPGPFPERILIELALKNATELEFSIPSDFVYFQGHFPGNPLVPGFVQIGWLLAFLELLLGKKVLNYKLSRFKFIYPIRPRDTVRISISEKGGKYRAKIMQEDKICCSGVIAIASDD